MSASGTAWPSSSTHRTTIAASYPLKPFDRSLANIACLDAAGTTNKPEQQNSPSAKYIFISDLHYLPDHQTKDTCGNRRGSSSRYATNARHTVPHGPPTSRRLPGNRYPCHADFAPNTLLRSLFSRTPPRGPESHKQGSARRHRPVNRSGQFSNSFPFSCVYEVVERLADVEVRH